MCSFLFLLLAVSSLGFIQLSVYCLAGLAQGIPVTGNASVIAGPERTLEQMAPHPRGVRVCQRGFGSPGEAAWHNNPSVKFNYKATSNHFAWASYLL